MKNPRSYNGCKKKKNGIPYDVYDIYDRIKRK